MTSEVIGLDIGGANIKYCSSFGSSGSLPFELWKHSELLSSKLQSIEHWNRAQHCAVTMTGELADCYSCKATGVAAICDAVIAAAPTRPALFYQTNGEFVNAEVAKSNWELTAASNWHGLASLVGMAVVDCLVVDVGSTTTDLIPVRSGKVVAHGNTDLTRIVSGELLYSGVIRSPVCAIVQSVNVGGKSVSIAQEFFANMLDVYLVLGHIAESDSCEHTADGRSATKENSFRRLAKMLCAQCDELGEPTVTDLAVQIANRHERLIGNAIENALNRLESNAVVVTGEGSFLVRRILSNLRRDIEVYFPDDLIHRFDPELRSAGISTTAAMVLLMQQHLLRSATQMS